MNEDELVELQERSADISEMADSRGWFLLRDYLVAQTETKQRFLLEGRAKTMEEYRELTGWIKGVLAALDGPATLTDQVAMVRSELEAKG